ncbi:MAG: hypothetical protein V7K97_15165 [Nostoc sp.]|uniref:hypothetical protein n=1 Tax=Nostoc sp. TaxID=1180 RepID=UPI002FF92A6A
MIISDLNYLENTSEEVIGGITILGIVFPNTGSSAAAGATASATGGNTNIAYTLTDATTALNSASASSVSVAYTSK